MRTKLTKTEEQALDDFLMIPEERTEKKQLSIEENLKCLEMRLAYMFYLWSENKISDDRFYACAARMETVLNSPSYLNLANYAFIFDSTGKRKESSLPFGV